MSEPVRRGPPKVGDRFAYTRTFTVDDTKAFTKVTGDIGEHHLTPDKDGRLMVHGLLTASLPTRIGGELNYLAREMHFEFIRAVHTGDTINTEVVITEIADEDRLIRMSAEGVCTNQLGKEVMKVKTNGVIFK